MNVILWYDVGSLTIASSSTATSLGLKSYFGLGCMHLIMITCSRDRVVCMLFLYFVFISSLPGLIFEVVTICICIALWLLSNVWNHWHRW